MPIGKNLKKDTLIPESAKKVTAKKAVKRKVTKKEGSGVSKKSEVFEEKVVQTIEVESHAKAPEAQHKIGPGKYIPESEFQERQRLRSKFDTEIKSYKGKILQLVTFPLGRERYAVDIDSIKEVVATPRISSIPHSPDFIQGVANIRGVVMVILDLAAKFEIKKEQVENAVIAPFTMVIKGVSFNAGVLVTEVPITMKVSGDKIVSSSGLLKNTALDETYIKGLINTDQGMYIYLDIRELIEDDDVKGLSRAVAK